jgi:hypothetical protein
MKKDLAILVAIGFLAGSASFLPSGVARADDKTVTTTTEKSYGDHDLDDADKVVKKKIVKRKHHGDEEKKTVVKKKTITKGDPDDETVVEKKTTTTDED